MDEDASGNPDEDAKLHPVPIGSLADIFNETLRENKVIYNFLHLEYLD